MTAKKQGKLLTPGTIAPVSGQGVEVGPRGGNPAPTEVTIVGGNRVPPTSEPGRKILITDKTKHK
ncbi:MAG: hypothetical protein M1598_01995 [Actinobacteria bacterium]|nr:hypothetical protein [Actinomycetota bacterium]